MSIFCEITLRWATQVLIKLAMVKVMAWCDPVRTITECEYNEYTMANGLTRPWQSHCNLQGQLSKYGSYNINNGRKILTTN